MKSLLRKTQIMWGDIAFFGLVVFPVCFISDLFIPFTILDWWSMGLIIFGLNAWFEILLGERKTKSVEAKNAK